MLQEQILNKSWIFFALKSKNLNSNYAKNRIKLNATFQQVPYFEAANCNICSMFRIIDEIMDNFKYDIYSGINVNVYFKCTPFIS